MKQISNKDVSRILSEVAEYLEMQDVAWKPRAYQKVARTIGELEEEVRDIYKKNGRKALEEIPGVGKSIALHLEEILNTGTFGEYETLKKTTPVQVGELTAVEGLGPKKIKKLYEALGVRTLAELERAAQKGKIASLEGFGKASEENIKKGIEFLKKYSDRFVLGFVMPEVRELEERLGNVEGVTRTVAAGSVRRRKETVGDIDMLVVAKNPEKVMDFFVRMREVEKVHAHGKTKSSVKLSSGLDADIRVVPEESWGAALNYFTGSKEHNVALRKIAIKKGYKLNEYGLFSSKGKGTRRVAGKTEEELYHALGMDYIEPEMREMTGEIEAAQRRTQGKHKGLPRLVGYDDLRGDLQVQTDWTDGSASIEEMAREAMGLGLQYIAVTDHTKRLAMTHGLDEKRLLRQMAEIDKVNEKLKSENTGFKILRGTECDILKDGSLDLSDEALSKLDVVGVAIHSHFNLSREDQTERVLRAIRNPHVDILFHPTGRVIQRREAVNVDMEQIVEVAKETGTVLEIDAYPDRLDLKDEHIRMCVDAGVKLAIDSDAHAPEHLQYLEYGIAQARRGWATKEDVINTQSVNEMLVSLKGEGYDE